MSKEKMDEGRFILILGSSNVGTALALKVMKVQFDLVMMDLDINLLQPGDTVYSPNFTIGQIKKMMEMDNITPIKVMFNTQKPMKGLMSYGEMTKNLILRTIHYKAIDYEVQSVTIPDPAVGP